MVLRKGPEKKFRSGPWNGLSFNGLPLITKTFFKSSLVDNVDEFYYSYELDDKSIITRLTLDELRIYVPAVEQNNQEVGYCGLFQNHKRKENFKIGPVAALGEHNWTAKREKNLWNLKGSNCLTCWNSRSAITLKKCEEECLRNCSCTTYTNSNISEGNNGCLIWFRDPIDIREFHEDNKQNIYIGMPTSELELMNIPVKVRNAWYLWWSHLLPLEFLSKGIVVLDQFASVPWRQDKKLQRNNARLLVYAQQSLDCFIFDQERSMLLNWPKQFDIVMGVAHGLLYLHQDSKTKLVIGTYGYMSPKYVIDGKFSLKSDVFSFGVLLLEIAWLLWNEGKTMELMDTCLKDSCIESQVLRCIQVGLLCVQKLPVHGPTMSSIIFMLGNKETTFPQLKQPDLFIERSFEGDDKGCYIEYKVTLTILEAR
ncbi:hypothetical protein VitviT2T_014442 [Vitis vinifera]|uniref:Apple domain-containing protein n=1 Tax=Vitis vinifera TaxID=29760 RepID=A0ABY9CM33_VITVI|nr:hypothetical protein VitviT2T_014442 [Vitis vinifera]